MNFNNFTIKSQEAVQRAQQIAQGFEHQQIENAHILKGILEVDENVTPFILKKLGVNVELFNRTLDNIIQSFPKVEGGELMLSKPANKMLIEAGNMAKKMKDEYVSLEHLLLAILNSKGDTTQLLKDNGINEKDLRSTIEELRKGNRVTSQSAEETYNSLKQIRKKP